MRASSKPVDPLVALARLEALCAGSEQSEFDLIARLRRWKVGESEIRDIIDSLTERLYVDNRRFAHAYVRDKFKLSRWGRQKIRMMLNAKRIKADFIDDAIEMEIDHNEYRYVLMQLMRGKAMRDNLEDDFDGRNRLLRYAVSRGFEPSICVEMLNKRTPWTQGDLEDFGLKL